MSQESFMQNWNNIIRDIIYPDEQLRALMRIPSNTTILNFIDNYFIRAGYTNETLKDEDVRIVYGHLTVGQQSQKVLTNQLSFDIYVKKEHLHNYGRDRLAMRTELIANRLRKLLTDQRYNHDYRFWIVGQSDMGTSAIGYTRYNISFHYMKIY